MDKNKAANFLETEAFVNPFFEKLAAEGVYPQTEEEANILLGIGFKKLAEYKNSLAKEATDRSSLLKAAAAELGVGVEPTAPASSVAESDYIVKAADFLAAHPEIQKAVDALNAA